MIEIHKQPNNNIVEMPISGSVTAPEFSDALDAFKRHGRIRLTSSNEFLGIGWQHDFEGLLSDAPVFSPARAGNLFRRWRLARLPLGPWNLLLRILVVLPIGAGNLCILVLTRLPLRAGNLGGTIPAAIPLATRKLSLARLILGPFVSRHPVISGLR